MKMFAIGVARTKKQTRQYGKSIKVVMYNTQYRYKLFSDRSGTINL